jgi:hypothetical protein
MSKITPEIDVAIRQTLVATQFWLHPSHHRSQVVFTLSLHEVSDYLAFANQFETSM